MLAETGVEPTISSFSSSIDKSNSILSLQVSKFPEFSVEAPVSSFLSASSILSLWVSVLTSSSLLSVLTISDVRFNTSFSSTLSGPGLSRTSSGTSFSSSSELPSICKDVYHL